MISDVTTEAKFGLTAILALSKESILLPIEPNPQHRQSTWYCELVTVPKMLCIPASRVSVKRIVVVMLSAMCTDFCIAVTFEETSKCFHILSNLSM